MRSVTPHSEVVAPLLQFRNFGIPLPHHWTTQNNGAAFGTDYFTRTAVAKSNTICVQADEPGDPALRVNWLPAPQNNQNFSLFMRAYWPEAAVTQGKWTPPAVEVAQGNPH